MFKKLLILLSLSTQTQSFSLLVTPEQAKKNMIEKAVQYSDYNLFAHIYNDPNFVVQNKAELKKMAEKVLNERLKISHNKSYSKKDIARIVGGLAGSGFVIERYYKYFKGGCLFFECKINHLPYLFTLGYCAYDIYQGTKHKDNSEKLRNAAAIKQMLKTPQTIEVKING